VAKENDALRRDLQRLHVQVALLERVIDDVVDIVARAAVTAGFRPPGC
jgi:hypothetical protein